MIKFIADSAADIKEYPGVIFESVPLTLSTDERSFVDDKDLDVHEMQSYFRKHNGRSGTACPSTQAWMDSFDGADEIYVVREIFEEYVVGHPEAKICVVDSLATGPGEVLLLEKMVELKNEGKTFEEVSEEILKYRESLRLFFGLASLHNLAQNGRVNKLVASAVGIMNIRILGTASKEGTIEQVAKCRGEKKLIQTTIDEMKKAGYKGGKVRICHVNNKALSDAIEDGLKKEFGAIDINSIPAGGLCSFYAEQSGIIIGCEK